MIPQIKLRSGHLMPGIGLGTFGSDRYCPQAVALAVRQAIRLGYRLVDCASVYGNEAEVGAVLAEARKNGVSRDDLFITSKVWNDSHRAADVLLSCARTLKDLQLDVLDLYLIHWPFRNFHPRGAAQDYHNPDAGPYRHEEYMETWYQMERLQKAGLVRQIGTSNMTVAKLRRLLRDCRIMPAANEMELHPTFQQPELFSLCIEHGIQPIGFSPLGSPSRPERDRTPQDVVDMEHPVVREISRAHALHPAQVCLKWAVQRGQVPIPFSVKADQLKSNLDAVCSDPLSETEMAAMASIDSGNRLIKGQVFLWDSAHDWKELWDGECD
ncbi:MAG: aldo/keto reductase [Bacillota bacterium]|nr:aldo/keto reductase [Bacillota bacterium]